MNSQQSIPRLDSEGRMGLDFHATRALRRFEHIQNPVERALAIADKKTMFREGDIMRTRLLGFLDQIDYLQPTANQLKFVDSLVSQSKEATSVWKHPFWIYVQQVSPTEDHVRKWLTSLSSQTLNIIQNFKEPTLVFVAPVPNLRQTQAITQRMAEKVESINYSHTDPFSVRCWESASSHIWRFGITDGQENMPFDEALYAHGLQLQEGKSRGASGVWLAEQYQKRFAAQGLDMIPQYAYLPLFMRQLGRGRVIDSETYTVLPSAGFLRPMIAKYNPYHKKILLTLETGGLHTSDLRSRPWIEAPVLD